MKKAKVEVKVKIPIGILDFLKAMKEEGVLEQTVTEYLEFSLIQIILADINTVCFGDLEALKKRFDLHGIFKKYGYRY